MAKQTIYIETTIPSSYFSQRTAVEHVARRNWTRSWWINQRHHYDLKTSDAVIEELNRGAHPLRNDKIALLVNLPLLDETASVLETLIFTYNIR